MENTYLTKKEFDELLEYSISVPTGTTIAKKWKRGIYKFQCLDLCGTCGPVLSAGYIPEGAVNIQPKEWMMGEYVNDPDPKKVGIRWTSIVISGELEIDKSISKFIERGVE